MKKSILLAALTLAACSSAPKSYIIEGIVPDDSYNNQMVYMFDYETQQNVDSAMVIDGKFTFTGTADAAMIRRMTLKRLYVNFVLENGKIYLDMAVPESAKGAPLNEELSKYMTERNIYGISYSDKYKELMQLKDVDGETLQKMNNDNLEQYKSNVNQLCSTFFDANKNNILGAFILCDWSNFLEPEQVETLYAEADDVVRNFKMLQNIVEAILRKKQTAEGMPFTDFTIENGNLDGSKVSLSDYVGNGKYLLVDFWASWCAPCIAEIPTLKEVYSKYKGDKFEILGIAVWDKREETLKSLEKHNTTWSQIIDANRIPTELYGIDGIPHIILFGPDGTIVARGLRGDALKAKIAEIMK